MLNSVLRTHSVLGAAVATCTAVLLSLTACSSGSGTSAASSAGGSAANSSPAANGAASGENPTLHAQLPADIKKTGKITIVFPGATPPYWIRANGSNGTYQGAAGDLSQEMGKILGVKVVYATNPDISGAIASISSGRYQMAYAPYGDLSGTSKARKGVDFVDVHQEVVPFLVKKGNPRHITNLGDDLCGSRIAGQANGAAYNELVTQAKKCKADGKPSLTVVSVTGTPNGVLALQSGRADAFFSSGAALFYFGKHSTGTGLEVVGADSPDNNGFGKLYQGIVLPAGSPLAQPVLGAFKEMIKNGSYTKIMKSYGLGREILLTPGVNLDKMSK